jgi:hypothetical protein
MADAVTTREDEIAKFKRIREPYLKERDGLVREIQFRGANGKSIVEEKRRLRKVYAVISDLDRHLDYLLTGFHAGYK